MNTTPMAWETNTAGFDYCCDGYKDVKIHVRLRMRVFKELMFVYTPEEFQNHGATEDTDCIKENIDPGRLNKMWRTVYDGEVPPWISPYVRLKSDVSVCLSINDMAKIMTLHPTKRVRQTIRAVIDMLGLHPDEELG